MSTIVKLVVVSLMVGLAMSFFGVTPKEFYQGVAGWAVGVWNWLLGAVGGYGLVILTGASVVVPIWLLHRLWTRRKRT